MTQLDLIATSTFGLEAVVARELVALGYESKTIQSGRVLFRADESAVARANLWLRASDRVLLRMGTFPAKDFGELFDRTYALPWEEWIAPDAAFPVSGRSIKSQLSSVPACQKIVKKAVVEKLRAAHRVELLAETGPKCPVEIALLEDQATLTLDTTGPGLHKRGYRRLVGEAPLKETLAAALVLLSFWRPDRPLVDPFCGTGTIPIEAALIGRNLAPGLTREFLAQSWPRLPKTLWDAARQEARDLARPDLGQRIIGTDLDEKALRLARHHAAMAGVEGQIHFQQRAFADLQSSQEYGCVICNPPYGERVGEGREVEALYRQMPMVLRRLKTWSHYILTSYPDFEALVGQQADRRRKLYNGRIQCTYYQFFGPKPGLPLSDGPESAVEGEPRPRQRESAAAARRGSGARRAAPDPSGAQPGAPDPSLAQRGSPDPSGARRGSPDPAASEPPPSPPAPLPQAGEGRLSAGAQPESPDPSLAQRGSPDPSGAQPGSPDPSLARPGSPDPSLARRGSPDPSRARRGSPDPAASEPRSPPRTKTRPAFGGLSPKAHVQAEIFRIRLTKRAHHLRRWPTRQGITCYRLYDADVPEIPLIVDRYEDCLHVADCSQPHDRTPAEHADWLDLMARTAAEALGVAPANVFLKRRQRQRGTSQYERLSEEHRVLVVSEGGLHFRVNLSDYVDTGLFLDHRITRSMVRELAPGKRFLNLFGYTGAFTVYAAAGGAIATTTVDLSNTYLDWAADNMRLNGFTGPEHQFVRDDALSFLEHRPRGAEFDLVVADPPTFSNSKRTEEFWDVERDHVELLRRLLEWVVPGGAIFFSTNFRRFKFAEAEITGAEIREISRQTVPPDFRNQRIHRCWRIVRSG